VARTQHEAGFSLVELLVIAGLVAVMAGIAIPEITAGMRRFAVTSASQQVASAIRTARFQAVSQNRTMRVRFNCPAAGQYRIVEVVNGAADTAGNRCDTAAYPYPPDQDPATVPNLDSSVMELGRGVQVTSVTDLQIDTAGRVSPLTGCPACAVGTAPSAIVVANSYASRTITVSGSGQVLLP
jgi:Tfp pilus assembly protein FimT